MQEREPDVKDLLALVRRQAGLVLAAAALVVALGMAFLLIATPVYQATALVLIDPADKNLLDPRESGASSAASDSARVDSEVEILRADATVLAVIARDPQAADPGLSRPRLRERLGQALGLRDAASAPSEAMLLRQLREATTVRRRGLTHLIGVTVRSPDPARAAYLANATVETYIARQVAAKSTALRAARDVLLARLDAAQATLSEAERRLDDYLARSAAEAEQDLVAARQRLAAAEAAWERGDWQELSSPSEEHARGDAGAAFGVVQALRASVAQHEARAAALRAAPDPDPAAFALRQEAEIARRQYQLHLERLRALEVQADLQLADSRIVSAAIVPLHPSFPDKRQILALSLVLGLVAGVGLALLKEYFIGGVTSARQLQNILHLPMAGTVPRLAASMSRPADMVACAPLSPFPEAIRGLRASLDRMLAGEGGKVILVTSSLPQEGKSTLALALARTHALAGKRVLLVDSDLRRPSLHRLLDLVPDLSLLDYLRDPAEAGTSFCARDPLSGAEVILGAGAAESPTDQLLASEGFAALLGEARAAFDVIVLDSPPVLPVVDTRYIAPLADAVVLVVRAGETAQGDLRQSVAQLQEVMRPGAALCLALNQEDESACRSRYYTDDPAETSRGLRFGRWVWRGGRGAPVPLRPPGE
ncbi:Wzz/FepE/Etk N-terminal domain-containing protein [Plastorhodobacter daqingensis]|uniref:Wzz/FepE/Etk N-terminal domain-containing protein n=1 Tax=Plastorhodobacter daqingensis TaxID=1387281 RepID=A0ABW2UMB2_9RHOB